MKLVLLIITLATTQAASIVPIDSSSVNVKQSGKDYSYSIHENRGVAISGIPVIHHEIPLVKTTHQIKTVPLPNPLTTIAHQQQDQQDNQQVQVSQQQIQLRAGTPLQEISYTLPIPIAYNYLPGYEYALAYPYGIQYPYNLIRAI